MDMTLAFTGDLAATLVAEEQRLKRTLSYAAELTATQVRDWWRADMARQGLSKRLQNTIKFRVYPKDRSRSLRPSATIISLAPKIMRGMAEATVIKSPGGGWLAIPTDNAPVRLRGKRPTPDLYEQVYGAGRLRFVETKLGRAGVLIDDDLRTRSGQTKSGRSRSRFVPRTAKSRSKAASAVMFTLVREVKTKQRFSLGDYESRGVELLAVTVREQLAASLSGRAGDYVADGFDADTLSQSYRQLASQSARSSYDARRTSSRRVARGIY